MQKIIEMMQYALEMAAGSVGMTALFLSGIVALWYNKYEEKVDSSCLFWYSIISLAAVVNPVYIGVVVKFFPELYINNIYLWILPTLPIIMYTGVKSISLLTTPMKKLFFGLGLAGVFLLAATTSYSPSTVSVAEKAYIEKEKKDILHYVSTSIDRKYVEDCLIWGDSDIMEFSRNYDGRIKTLYGKDLWENGITDAGQYDHAYDIMKEPGTNIDEIGYLAEEYGCSYIILAEEDFDRAGVPVPETTGSYYLEYTDDTYLLYVYANYAYDITEDN